MLDQIQQYLIPWSAGIMISLLVTVLCMRKPLYGRRLLAILFLLGMLANVYLAWIYPRDYLVFGQFTFLDSYRRFIYLILFRQAYWMGGLLILAHAYLAFSYWRNEAVPTPAIIGAALFLLLITPLGFGAAFPAPLILLFGIFYLYKNNVERAEA